MTDTLERRILAFLRQWHFQRGDAVHAPTAVMINARVGARTHSEVGPALSSMRRRGLVTSEVQHRSHGRRRVWWRLA